MSQVLTRIRTEFDAANRADEGFKFYLRLRLAVKRKRLSRD